MKKTLSFFILLHTLLLTGLSQAAENNLLPQGGEFGSGLNRTSVVSGVLICTEF